MGTPAAEPERKQQSLTLSVKEAAELLGVSQSLMYELVAAGRVPVLRLSKRLRVPRRAVEQLVEDALTVRPDEQPWGRLAGTTPPASLPVPPYSRGRRRSGL